MQHICIGIVFRRPSGLLLNFKAPWRLPGPADILLLICFPEVIRGLFRNIPAPGFPVFTPLGKSHRSGALLPSFPFSHPERRGRRKEGIFFLLSAPGEKSTEKDRNNRKNVDIDMALKIYFTQLRFTQILLQRHMQPGIRKQRIISSAYKTGGPDGMQEIR